MINPLLGWALKKILGMALKSLFKRQGRVATMQQIRGLADDIENKQRENDDATGRPAAPIACAVGLVFMVALLGACSLRTITDL